MPKEKKKTYPAKPNKEGFYFESKEEEAAGVKTKDYDNGSTIKEVTLKNGRKATVRKLKGRDFVETKKRIQADDNLDFETVNMSQSVSFDEGKNEPPEYFLDDLFQEDYATLMIAFGALNF